MTASASSLTSVLMLYLFNALWQIPLVFAAAWIASRLARSIGSHAVHRVWVSAFFAELLLPVFHIEPQTFMRLWAGVLATLSWPWHNHSVNTEVRIVTGPVVTTGSSGLHLPPALIAASLAAWMCISLYFAARLAWGLYKMQIMRSNTIPLSVVLQSKVDISLAALNAKNVKMTIAISSHLAGPSTVGLFKRALLFPRSFLDKVSTQDLTAVLAHELAHMRRNDFAKNIVYELLSIVAAFHPVLWLTRSRIAESREMLCDDLAATHMAKSDSRDTYAMSLLNMATTLYPSRPSSTIQAIGIFDANIFERRIMHLTRKSIALPRAQQIAILAVCCILVITTGTSALALHVNAIASAQEESRPSKLKVDNDKLTIVNKVQPVYPPEEKKKGTTGTVALAAVIGKEGQVENLRVKSSPSEGLSRSALDAVRQWRYQPYLLNGDPIEVETTINIIFALGK